MHFKSFPKTIEGSTYPLWEEVVLTEKEEFVEEQKARRENISLMRKCIEDAKKLMDQEGMAEYQSDVLGIALSLYRKRASHVVYWKDRRCKEKFDFKNSLVRSPAKNAKKEGQGKISKK
ncbi:MAG: hypothetical protein KKE20_06590 [Nanoarchaeota archaeon]|nr:hypothetical protein [Nanoarchaeota archaeon]